MRSRRIPYARLWALPLIFGLHLGTYLVVTRVIDRYPASVISTIYGPLDAWIPHLPATWPLYWAAYPYVILCGSAAMLRLSRPAYVRGVAAFALMIALGAIGHLAFPAPAPWPIDPHPLQRATHESFLTRPWATLPSMHVAFCTLTSVLLARAFSGWRVPAAGWLITFLVALSTLTLKEHVVLDAVAGMSLGLIIGTWWSRGLHPSPATQPTPAPAAVAPSHKGARA